MKYNKDTSEKILNAATSIFEEKGYSGARMQEIADKASINKALLHYYYKSKDKLFELILKRAIQLVLPKIHEVMLEDLNIFERIEHFTSIYIDLITKNPHIPGFVIHEISSNPNRLIKLIAFTGLNLDFVKEIIRKEIKKGTIIDIEPEQLIMNIISLCILPFIAKPIVVNVLLDGNEDQFKKLMEERKTEVSKFIINAIKK